MDWLLDITTKIIILYFRGSVSSHLLYTKKRNLHTKRANTQAFTNCLFFTLLSPKASMPSISKMLSGLHLGPQAPKV